MKLIIQIRMNGAAFEEGNGYEAARILRDLADKIALTPRFNVGEEQPLRDCNGNNTGFCQVYEDKTMMTLHNAPLQSAPVTSGDRFEEQV